MEEWQRKLRSKEEVSRYFHPTWEFDKLVEKEAEEIYKRHGGATVPLIRYAELLHDEVVHDVYSEYVASLLLEWLSFMYLMDTWLPDWIDTVYIPERIYEICEEFMPAARWE